MSVRDRSSAHRPIDDPIADVDLPRGSVRGGAAVAFGQVVTTLLGFVSISILGRLLTPDDFGLIAMTAAFMALITNFSELGLPQATVQQKSLSHAQVNAIFWLNVMTGAAGMLLGLAAAYPISWFFGEPALVGVTAAMSVAFLISGIGAQHQALLRRHLRFVAQTVVTICAVAGGIAVGIIAALGGAGYWALVLQSVATVAFRAVGLWLASDWRPGRPQPAEGVREMIRFGAYLTGTNLLGTTVRNLDRILIGRFAGAAALGFYSNGHRILLLPIQQFGMPLTTVAIPTLSRLQDEPERFKAFYSRGLEAIATILLAVTIPCIIAADHVVLLVLGDQWSETVPIIRAMGPAAILGTLNVATTWVFIPLGRSDRQFRWHLFRSGCVVMAYFAGISWGAEGVAWAYSITACLLRIPAMLYCFKGTFIGLADAWEATWRAFAASAAASVVTTVLAVQVTVAGGAIANVILLFSVFIMCYACGWLLVPGGRRRLSIMIQTCRHLAPIG